MAFVPTRPILPLFVRLAAASTVGMRTPRILRSFSFGPLRYFFWRALRAFAEAVLQARITSVAPR